MLDLHRVGAEQVVALHPGGDLVPPGTPSSRASVTCGAKRRRSRLEPGALQRRLHLGLQVVERRVALHAGPERMHLAALLEGADARELQREARRAQPGQRVVDLFRPDRPAARR